MKRNEALQAELSELLEKIRTKLTSSQGRNLYKSDLEKLAEAINHSLVSGDQGSSFFKKNDVVKCIMVIMKKIDNEIARLDKETKGLQNYPSISNERIDDIGLKQTIKNDLKTMLDKIIAARPEHKQEIRLAR